ncbi:MAG: hypothetical protein QM695_16000 [Micropruina sp.]
MTKGVLDSLVRELNRMGRAVQELLDQQSGDGRLDVQEVTHIVVNDPLPADVNWARVERVLGAKIVNGLPDRQIVGPPLVAEGEADLLCAERQEVDGLGERSDVGVRVALELRTWCGSCDADEAVVR